MINKILLIVPINAMPQSLPSNRYKKSSDQRIYLKSLWQSGEDSGGLRCFVVGVDLWLDWMDTEKGSWTSHIWEVCCEEFSELDTNQPHHQRYSGEEMPSQNLRAQTFLYSQASSVQLKGETPIRSLHRLTMKLSYLALPAPALHTWRNVWNKNKIKPTTLLSKLGTKTVER